MSAVWQSAAMLADPTICGNCFDPKQTYSMGKQSSPSQSLSTYFCAISSMFHIFLCKHWLIGPMGFGKLCTMYNFFSCLSEMFWKYRTLIEYRILMSKTYGVIYQIMVCTCIVWARHHFRLHLWCSAWARIPAWVIRNISVFLGGILLLGAYVNRSSE